MPVTIHSDTPAGRRVLHGVIDQDDEELLETIRVAVNRHWLKETHPYDVGRTKMAGLPQHVQQHSIKFDRYGFDRDAGVGARQGQQVGQQRRGMYE